MASSELHQLCVCAALATHLVLQRRVCKCFVVGRGTSACCCRMLLVVQRLPFLAILISSRNLCMVRDMLVDACITFLIILHGCAGLVALSAQDICAWHHLCCSAAANTAMDKKPVTLTVSCWHLTAACRFSGYPSSPAWQTTSRGLSRSSLIHHWRRRSCRSTLSSTQCKVGQGGMSCCMQPCCKHVGVFTC